MDGHAFLANLALVLGVAALTTVLFQRLRLPVVFGYLLAGMIVGPYLPVPLVADASMVRALAELGVILLMYAIGLEFRLKTLVQMGSTAGLAAATESALMFALGYATAEVLGWSSREALFTGGMVAISSTTIIARTFADKQIGGRWKEIVFGILLVEDLIAILLVAVLSTIAQGDGPSASAIALTGIQLGTFLAALLGIGLLVVPRLMRHVISIGRTEITVVTAVGIAFGAAWLALTFGYSVALGAFIAGSLVAESGHGDKVEHLVAPIRDVFVAIFFVAVGMLLDPRAVADHAGAVVALTLLVLVGKTLAASLGAFLSGNGLRESVRAGMSLAQIGEFSFIIAGVGLAAGAIRPALYPVAVAVSAITTLLTPYMVSAADGVAREVDRRMPRRVQTFLALYGSWIERIRASGAEATRTRAAALVRLALLDVAALAAVIIGTGAEMPRVGVWIGAWFQMSATAGRWTLGGLAMLLALPLAIGLVRTTRALASELARRALPLPTDAHLDRAAAPRRALTSTLHASFLFGAAVALDVAAKPFFPAVPGVAILLAVTAGLVALVWRDAGALYGHATAGAEVIVLALSQHDRRSGSLAELSQTMEHMSALLPGLGEPVPVRIGPESSANGRTLRELNLRAATGALVLAITRASGNAGEAHVPNGDERLAVGDVLALAGTREAVAAARALLDG